MPDASFTNLRGRNTLTLSIDPPLPDTRLFKSVAVKWNGNAAPFWKAMAATPSAPTSTAAITVPWEDISQQGGAWPASSVGSSTVPALDVSMVLYQSLAEAAQTGKTFDLSWVVPFHDVSYYQPPSALTKVYYTKTDKITREIDGSLNGISATDVYLKLAWPSDAPPHFKQHRSMINGGFEEVEGILFTSSGTNTGSGVILPLDKIERSNNTKIHGWTVVRHAFVNDDENAYVISKALLPSGSIFTDPHSGDKYLLIRGCSLKRVLAVKPNVEHTLSWWNRSFRSQHSMTVTIRQVAGAAIGTPTTYTNVTLSDWESQSLVFTTTHTSIEVEFMSNAHNGNSGMLIDDIDLDSVESHISSVSLKWGNLRSGSYVTLPTSLYDVSRNVAAEGGAAHGDCIRVRFDPQNAGTNQLANASLFGEALAASNIGSGAQFGVSFYKDMSTKTGTASYQSPIIVPSAVVDHTYASGVVTYDSGWTIHTFTTVGLNKITFNKPTQVEYLIVGGGGMGGRYYGGGGGAGGLLTNVGSTKQAVTAKDYIIQVGKGGDTPASNRNSGDGGAGLRLAGDNGGNSSFDGLVAFGGGGGGGEDNRDGKNGGSGGGTGEDNNNPSRTPGSGTSLQGNDGCTGSNGSGGGGAGAAGGTGTYTYPTRTGGIGKSNSITGTSVWYAGGGGGSANGPGGQGGGTTGANDGTAAPHAADNTGGGGGGGSGPQSSGNGGSGIVVIRYQTAA